jgi:hypothetical protein
MSVMMSEAAQAIEKPEVQAMIKALAEHGLGVFIPHMHTEGGGFAPLPTDTVQMESDLSISFVKNNDPILANATVVGWVWDKQKARVAAACACSGNHFPGSCSSSE